MNEQIDAEDTLYPSPEVTSMTREFRPKKSKHGETVAHFNFTANGFHLRGNRLVRTKEGKLQVLLLNYQVGPHHCRVVALDTDLEQEIRSVVVDAYQQMGGRLEEDD